MNEAGSFVLTLLHAATNAHLLHLKSRSYAEHMALGTFYAELPDLVDALAESIQGLKGELLDYYRQIAHAALPYFKDRPVTLRLRALPGKGPMLHNHDTNETFICLEGKWKVIWGRHAEHSVLLDKYDVCSIPPFVPRRFECVEPEAGNDGQQSLSRGVLGMTVAHIGVALCDSLQQRQHEGDGGFGDAEAIGFGRRVADHDAELGCGVRVHIIDADRVFGDDAQALRGLHDAPADRGVAHGRAHERNRVARRLHDGLFVRQARQLPGVVAEEPAVVEVPVPVEILPAVGELGAGGKTETMLIQPVEQLVVLTSLLAYDGAPK